jgi:hypothetical protein
MQEPNSHPTIKRFQMLGIPTGGAMGQSQIQLIIAGLGEDGIMYRWNGDKVIWEVIK